jgi:hypothetical protein
MPIKAAMWVPGTAARVEYPERLTWRPPVSGAAGLPPNPPQRDITINGAQVTFSQEYQSGTWNSNWFHFPIPTPVILDDMRVQLLQVFIFYEAQLARLISVHVWDGPNRVWERNNLSHDGHHLEAIDSLNTFPLNPPPTIFWGINISVQVEFLPEELAQPQIRSLVVFSTAGADFITA